MKVAADLGSLLSGTVVGIVTARALGPSGKGTLSALLFMSGLLGQACLLGMGDASVVWIAKGRVSGQRALSCGLTVGLGASLIGAIILGCYGLLQLPVHDSYVAPALAAAALTLVISGTTQMLLYIVYGTGGAVAVSAVTLSMSLSTGISVVVLVALLHLSILGATLGSLAGALVGLASGLPLLRRRKLRVRFAYDRTYAASAIRFGLKTQLASIFAVSSARMDLLLVYAFAGSGAAGQYSVALTIGALAATAALAMSYASFGGIASAPEATAIDLLVRTARVGLLLSLGGALLGMALVPFAVPIAFGLSYADAIGPSAVLLLANVLWSGQWIVSRGFAARGDASLVLSSFAANLTVMLIGALLLVPSVGAMGGALASLVASAVGFSVCVRRFRTLDVTLWQLVPRSADAMVIVDFPRRVLRSLISKRLT